MFDCSDPKDLVRIGCCPIALCGGGQDFYTPNLSYDPKRDILRVTNDMLYSESKGYAEL